jgi:alcohol dehydrogenase
MNPFDARPSPRLVFGAGRLSELPGCVASFGAETVLLVTDPGIVAAGHVARATAYLEAAGIVVGVYEGTHCNPTESDIEACRVSAASLQPDVIIGLGGGSSMDTAKGCNFLLHHGGRMADYRGYGLAKNAMLPFIAIPTTAGTGSECQSYAVVSRDESHEKMACGAPGALARIAILDPELTASQPRSVATLTALDALSHALESAVCTQRNPVSSAYSEQAFRLIAVAIRPVLQGGRGDDATPIETRGRMLLGAALAGAAIENSMLGAAHAAANPLTARFDLAHGHAVALMLPHVVRLNAGDPAIAAIYDELSRQLGGPLLPWLEETIALAELPAPAIDSAAIPELAAAATQQWTGRFNPVAVDLGAFTALYEKALSDSHSNTRTT